MTWEIFFIGMGIGTIIFLLSSTVYRIIQWFKMVTKKCNEADDNCRMLQKSISASEEYLDRRIGNTSNTMSTYLGDHGERICAIEKKLKIKN